MMGALAEGFETARRKSEADTAESHRKELAVDEHLLAVSAVLDQDAGLLKDNDFTHETAHRILRISHRRSPVITVHFDPDGGSYVVTSMRDGTRDTAAAADECARAIGNLMFREISVK